MKQSSTTSPRFLRSLLALLLLPILSAFVHATPPGSHPAAKRSQASVGAAPVAAASVAAAPVVYAAPVVFVDPKTKDFHIVISVQSDPGAVLCDPNQMTIELRFLSTLFYPMSVTRGSIVSSTVSGDNRTVTISLAGTQQVANGTLTELVGDVLLGNSESTPLTLLSVKCAGVQVTDSIQNGELRMAGSYCEQGSDRLIVYRDGFGITKIVPNPARGGVTIGVLAVELGQTDLEIYSSLGQRVFATSWSPASIDELSVTKKIELPEDLPNGMYQVVVRSTGRHDTQTLIIAK